MRFPFVSITSSWLKVSIIPSFMISSSIASCNPEISRCKFYSLVMQTKNKKAAKNDNLFKLNKFMFTFLSQLKLKFAGLVFQQPF